MKKIKLTQGKYALVDDWDYEFLSRFTWSYSSLGYAHCKKKLPKGKTLMLYMHRLVLDIWGDECVDHVNEDKLDNRKDNLRNASHSQNKWNRSKPSTNTSGYKGVVKTKAGKWQAQISANRKHYHLGVYSTPEEAFEAYKKAAVSLHGEFARW